MPWYFYNGQVPVPVTRVDGAICVVRPRGYIEAKPENVRKYGAKMVRTAPPRAAVTEVRVPPQPVPTVEELRSAPVEAGAAPKFADVVAETGVTHDMKNLPPRPPVPRRRRPAENE